eukprot:1158605-Pelagomonas_calceolata.AAC.5
MILNRCKDVVIRMCQLGVELHPGSKTFGGGLGGHMKGFDPQNREQVSWQDGDWFRLQKTHHSGRRHTGIDSGLYGYTAVDTWVHEDVNVGFMGHIALDTCIQAKEPDV